MRGQEGEGEPVTCGKHLRDRGGLSASHTAPHPGSPILKPTTRSTSSATLPSSNSTLEPRNLRTSGFTWTVPDRMRLGSSSFTVGCWLNNLTSVTTLLIYVSTMAKQRESPRCAWGGGTRGLQRRPCVYMQALWIRGICAGVRVPWFHVFIWPCLSSRSSACTHSSGSMGVAVCSVCLFCYEHFCGSS